MYDIEDIRICSRAKQPDLWAFYVRKIDFSRTKYLGETRKKDWNNLGLPYFGSVQLNVSAQKVIWCAAIFSERFFGWIILTCNHKLHIPKFRFFKPMERKLLNVYSIQGVSGRGLSRYISRTSAISNKKVCVPTRFYRMKIFSLSCFSLFPVIPEVINDCLFPMIHTCLW